ncbi:MAG TPA: prolyl oligopeptidase family serine peptidase [Segeticoccus sp.]|uniref:S9 family peptidase n=1 Tax=Segeticoccus sp. TaxID=2706531 RepID=UPI002D7FB6EB|nr:prolyl oligopeptidase family serine peptidase [Segeticoccus sp.]HET8601122.1 prolyl oligopeptidase family serine peptidase [Segeticoccus sp.]
MLPEGWNVRSRVHEYGGGAYAVRSGRVVFVDFAAQRLWQVRADDGAPPVPVTPEGAMRYGGLVLDERRGAVFCVREDHSGDGSGEEPANTLVRVDLDAAGNPAGTVLVEGPDFVSRPALSADGSRIAWVQWNHPNMPWDSTTLWVAELDESGSLRAPRRVAGGPGEAITEPVWAPDGRLVFLSDRTGWANLYAVDLPVEEGDPADPAPVATALLPMEREFGTPQWTLGMSSYGFAGDRLVCTWLTDGLAHLGVLSPVGHLTELTTPATDVTTVQAGDDEVVCHASFADNPGAIVRISLCACAADVALTELARSSEPVDARYVPRPEPVEWTTGGAHTAYGFFYAPTNPHFIAPEGERPPLVVMCHGGPTSFHPGAFRLDVAWFTSRGVAVLDVNYRGSSGYGRAYREQLQGNWGIVDVEDCSTGALAMAELGRADASRLAITGGSAGGYTTLAALTFTDTFSAGASFYGISDLSAIAQETHKFESHYTDGLVGPWPAAREVYAERSPVRHVDRLSCPLILLQGADDLVVPPNQAQLMAEAVAAKGLPVAFLLFEGEGHGFRRAENVVRAREAELWFYGEVFGFTPADEIAPVDLLTSVRRR